MKTIIISFKQYLRNKNIPIEDITAEDVDDFMWKESLYGEDIFNTLIGIKNDVQ
jgi:hypothetical protein